MKIKKGMKIKYFLNGRFGEANINRIDLVPSGHKYGLEVDSADLETVMKTESYVLELDNNKWLYGWQVTEVIS